MEYLDAQTMPSASYTIDDQTENVLAAIEPIDERFSPPGTDAYNIVFKQWWETVVQTEPNKGRQEALRMHGEWLAKRSRTIRHGEVG